LSSQHAPPLCSSTGLLLAKKNRTMKGAPEGKGKPAAAEAEAANHDDLHSDESDNDDCYLPSDGEDRQSFQLRSFGFVSEEAASSSSSSRMSPADTNLNALMHSYVVVPPPATVAAGQAEEDEEESGEESGEEEMGTKTLPRTAVAVAMAETCCGSSSTRNKPKSSPSNKNS
jgi:hypothetical protein